MWITIIIILSIFTLIFFLMCSFRDPGYLKNDRVEFLRLLEQFDPTHLCPDCFTIRTIRSRHCSVCHRCVERFDHHCPWINNCIGIRNHNYFLAYILTQYVLLTIVILIAIIIMAKENIKEGKCSGGSIINPHFVAKNISLNPYLFFFGSSIIVIIGGLFILPLT